jgi:putative ABC transport system substrate-binding protein
MRFNHLKRREFIRILAGAASTWSLSARAQTPPKPASLGYIWIGSKGSERSTLDGIRQGLHELGYAEGRDFILEDRYADSEPERLPAIVAELLRLKVELFLSPGNPVTRAAMQGTSTIPIIATTPDLLASGFVASLARPGGNVTGISLTAGATLSEKWLELLKETFPNVTRVAVLSNLTSASSAYLDRMRMVASILGVQPQYFAAQDPAELDHALAEITAMMPDGFVVESDASLSLIARKLSLLRPSTDFRPSMVIWITSPTVASWPTTQVSSMHGAGWPVTWIRSSRALSRAIFRSSRRQNLSCS